MSEGQNTTRVRQTIDVRSLATWMSKQSKIISLLCTISDKKDITLKEKDISIRQFGFGQSNPTYLLTIACKPSKENPETSSESKESKLKFVLRKKPNKVAHKSAHALHREYRVLKAIQKYNASLTLNNTNESRGDKSIPVPSPIVYCTSSEIIGAEFYIMEYIQGRIFIDPTLPTMTPIERSLAYRDAIRILANIHSMPYSDPRIDLNTFGKSGKYVQRQIRRLSHIASEQAKTPGVGPIKGIDEMIAKLSHACKHCPDRASLIHGDYKMDNLIFHPTEPRVIGVLDWELSTIGDPMCDLANLCMMYFMPGIEDGLGVAGLGRVNFEGTGIPDRTELVRLYSCMALSGDGERQGQSARARAGDVIMAWRGFYLAFLFFKNCVIVHGVKQRAALGVASSAMAKKVAGLLPTMVKMTMSVWEDEPPPVPTTTRSKL